MSTETFGSVLCKCGAPLDEKSGFKNLIRYKCSDILLLLPVQPGQQVAR